MSRLVPHALALFLVPLAAAHHHEETDARASQRPRFHTSRTSTVDLPLPEEQDAFVFVVFGDRTGGPPEGIKVLAQAVEDTNLFAPDLVMTVGDLVQGYNETPKWLEQMQEYKATMAKLPCPWFPVAGNHDIYWRGKGPRPAGEHEVDFEQHFGPLWYAFEHKKSWFIALHSDEGNPATGEKNFDKPECQRMSDAQFAWLEAALARAKGADHVFLFLHHPRWLAQKYGDDWERVHALLKSAGNVSAVFAGHIHHMRYDGERDGIEYFALATVGGQQDGFAAAAGYLHQFNVVTVRRDRLSMATLPVGTVMDPRAITGKISEEVAALAKARPTRVEGRIEIGGERAASGVLALALSNPTSRAVDIEVEGTSADARWIFEPDHVHAKLGPGEERRVEIHARRLSQEGGDIDAALRAPGLVLGMDYLGEGLRVPLPRSTLFAELDAAPRVFLRSSGSTDLALALDGKGQCLKVRIDLPPGVPLTVEGWLRAEHRFEKRQGFLCKTEQSDYGLFVDEGRPSFSIHLGGKYVRVQAKEPLLKLESWAHVAGVFDGQEVRLYVDGRLVDRAPGKGARKRNELPLVIGADVRGDATPESFFRGQIDEVRLSRVARYTGERFRPERRFEPAPDTSLLLHLDGNVALWTPDASGSGRHALVQGDAQFVERR